jgi:uncharacterized protein YcfJ
MTGAKPKRRSSCRQWSRIRCRDGVAQRGRPRRPRHDAAASVIEVEIEGVMVRVGHGAEAKAVAAVLRALKGGA